MLLVASSKIMMELRRRRARAKAINCLWPWEKLVPPADTFVSSVMVVLVSTSVPAMDEESTLSSCSLVWTDGGRDAVRDEGVLGVMIWTRERTSRHSLSVCSPTKNNGHLTQRYTSTCGAYIYLPNGSRLSLKVPEKSVASYSFWSTEVYPYYGIAYLRYKCLRYRR